MKATKARTIDYFLTNPDFISWVRNPTGNRNLFWKTWLKNHPEDKETFHNAIAVLHTANFRTSKIPISRQQQILGNILRDTPGPQYQQHSKLRKQLVGACGVVMKSAAIVILLATISLLLPNNFQGNTSNLQASLIAKHATDGERLSFYLPDSTLVLLNSGSTLQYSSQFNNTTREVALVGEAYFDVKHNSEKEFLVRSGTILTRVHGTSFNVRAYQGELPISVSLEHGSVAVHSRLDTSGNLPYKILPGEKLTVERDFEKSEISHFDYETEFGWKHGILAFDEADLNAFVGIMERWYGIDINVVGKSKDNWAISGRFKNEEFENVLKSLEFSRQIIYKINGNQVTLFINQ